MVDVGIGGKDGVRIEEVAAAVTFMGVVTSNEAIATIRLLAVAP